MRKTFNESKITLRHWPNGESLSIWHLSPGLWSFCHAWDGHESRVGPMYPTKTAIMLESESYIHSWEN